MKVHLLILTLLVIGFISCGDDDICCVTPPEIVTLVGDWKLDKLCFSNGASSCNEEDLWEPDYSECVTFTEDTFSFDRDGVMCIGNYVLTDMGFTMKAESRSECVFETIDYIIIEHTFDKLTMSPLCIEGCPHVYVRK